MKRVIIYLATLTFFIQSSLFAYSSNPKDFVDELVNDAISKLADINLNKDQKVSFIEKIALENVDINALGLYTLGVLRKSSNEDDISNYQKERNKALNDLTKTRIKASTKLINKLTPILETYSKENSIGIIIQKKHIVMGSKEDDITKEILDLVNQKIKSIKID